MGFHHREKKKLLLRLEEDLRANPGMDYTIPALMERYGLNHGPARDASIYLRGVARGQERARVEEEAEKNTGPDWEDLMLRAVRRLKSAREPVSMLELGEGLEVDLQTAEEVVGRLRENKYKIELDGPLVSYYNVPEQGGEKRIDTRLYFGDDWIRFGALSDSHFSNKHARLDAAEALFDIYDREGIRLVFHAGNWIDGYKEKINRFEILPGHQGVTAQCEHFIKTWPRRDGIVTEFIAGDDHEGWFSQDVGIDVGAYLEMTAREHGRQDLVHLGYKEHDVYFEAPEGATRMRITHPGGGSAYAVSYSVQKEIESYQGGDKPAVLLVGHYHKAEYLPVRNVHAVQCGCLCDQTLFMRKRKLQAHVGGWIIEMKQGPQGEIIRFRAEWIPFFDKGFYDINGRYRQW